MPRLNVSGSVFYRDMTPAGNVVVKLIELDADPGSNDLILTRTTDGSGSFSGRTSNWKDQESRGLFGIAVPDVFRLNFEVVTPVGTHRGPFVITPRGSLPIILPFGPFKPVGKDNRELVQITFLSEGYELPEERLLYQFIEAGSNAAVDHYLADDYRRIHRITGNQATLANLVAKLNTAASRASTLAVDLVVCTHGNSNRLHFKDGVYRASDVKDAILDATSGVALARREKFRMVFSTACFGSTHNLAWMQAGFKVASGSVGIYADSQASMAPFFNAWQREKTFEECIASANNGDIGDVADNLAKEFYRIQGRTDDANTIDSTRVVRGNKFLRIYSSPE